MEPPSAPGPERLFDSHRLPADGFLLLALLLYAPVGLCLLVLRLFVGLHVFLVSCALPDCVRRCGSGRAGGAGLVGAGRIGPGGLHRGGLHRAGLHRAGLHPAEADPDPRPDPRALVRPMCAVLGFVAWQEDSALRDRRLRVLLANHVTPFDHNVVHLLTGCATVSPSRGPGRGRPSLGLSLHRSALSLPPAPPQPLLNSPPSFVCWSRGFTEMDGRLDLVEALRRFCASTSPAPAPLLLFPEEEATNGREGLLHFRWVPSAPGTRGG